MKENVGGPGVRSCREKSGVSVETARAHQQSEDAVFQSCRTEHNHRDFQGRECNREVAASRLRNRGFKRHGYRRPVLQGGTDPRTHN